MPDYRRNLPHWYGERTPIFATWRLYGSVPACARDKVLMAFVERDRELDRQTSGPRWLMDTRIARLVADALVAGETERRFYKLHAWVIMPNHVHLLLTPSVPLATITRWLKGSTARGANKILGFTGQPFWKDESWDHWVRNSDELRKITRYIHENPVKAGLVKTAELWHWSSTGQEVGQAVPPVR